MNALHKWFIILKGRHLYISFTRYSENETISERPWSSLVLLQKANFWSSPSCTKYASWWIWGARIGQGKLYLEDYSVDEKLLPIFDYTKRSYRAISSSQCNAATSTSTLRQPGLLVSYTWNVIWKSELLFACLTVCLIFETLLFFWYAY